jgi:hypothetical protein
MYRGVMQSLKSFVTGAVLVVILGCAGTPGGGAAGEVPDWVAGTVPSDARYEYFVGSSSDYDSDTSRAEQQAVYSLIDEITRYMGVRITSETTAEARASLEEFESSIRQEVRQTGSARMEGFRVVDRYVERRDDRVTVYILGRYDADALEAERKRLQAVFQEQIDAVAVPEGQARTHEQRGEFYDAAVKYIEAAHAAAGSDLENASIRFERNMAAARRVVSEVQLIKLNDNLEGLVREDFPEDFRLRLETAAGPVPGGQVRISYRLSRGGARPVIRTETIRAGADGVVSFRLPRPELVGPDSVTMALDLSSHLALLEELDRRFRPQVDSLIDEVLSRRAVFQYEVVSKAREIPTGVVVLDTDIAGNPSGTSAAAAGIVQELTQAGFRVRILEFDAARLQTMSDEETVAMFRRQFGEQVDRVVFGRVQIDDFQESDGFIVRVSGSVTAVSLADGEVLHSYSTFIRSRGSSSSGAISAAFRNIGNTFGQELASRLP